MRACTNKRAYATRARAHADIYIYIYILIRLSNTKNALPHAPLWKLQIKEVFARSKYNSIGIKIFRVTRLVR
jgi:hypothetical protein